ncbi:MAG: YifB family Mg chelatase-like AAA ATPase [Elusimicrobiota bacterium]|jgi:magnesium chelatase family protein|nr:YifB family Mg chelatase-like AAA ATPase [Elusimicrobiota bacterium]
MFSLTYSAAINGIDADIVEVETYISNGMPGFFIVGLPDTAVKESRDRVAAALKNSGFDFPPKKITVNLAPADTKKEGGIFDLPIALGILSASGIIKKDSLLGFCIAGELALDGKIRKVKGILPIALSLSKTKIKKIIVPFANRQEAAASRSVSAFSFKTLDEVVKFINGTTQCEPYIYNDDENTATVSNSYDFADIKGQKNAKRAVEISAAGGHNILMSGPPGSGKTMIAKRMPSILPPMTFEESVETTKIWSSAGHNFSGGLIKQRPFRSPHHTISAIALAGGGAYPKPGEVSLSHNGILFLDELPEFRRDALEILRQPLEDKKIMVSRTKNTFVFPASFMLVTAMNPCPCGNLGHREKQCICTPYQIQKYRGKISGPLMDRIDIYIEVPALKFLELTEIKDVGEHSQEIKQRVTLAREIQNKRFKGTGIYVNAQMRSKEIKKHCILDDKSYAFLKNTVEKLNFSARSYDKILKVARTIADLENESSIKVNHISQAVQYRFLDRQMGN